MNALFTFSHSVKPLPRKKADNIIGCAKWTETEGDLQDLITLIKEDKAIINNFYHEGENFTTSQKNQANLKSAYLIMFDFDAVKLTAEDFFNLMSQTEIQPTLVYTTANNGKQKHKNEVYFNRYRVIYLLNQPIHDYWVYERVHVAIEDEIRILTDMLNDNSDHTCEHLFCGNPNAEIYTSDSSYDVDFFIDRYDVDTTPPTEEEAKPNRERQKREKYTSPVTEDYWNMSLDDFFVKYQGEFVNIMATPLEESPFERVVEIPDDYLYIYRRWHMEEYELKSGVKRISMTDRLQKGERNRKLFANLCIRRQITPTLSFDNLLHNAVYELLNHVDNEDGSLTRYELFSIVQSAYAVPVESLHYTSKRKHEYRISRAYCRAHGTTAREENAKEQSERMKRRKAERDAEITKLYNPTLTYNENLSLLLSEGIDISLSTLKRILLCQGGQLSDNNTMQGGSVLQLTWTDDTKEKLLNEIKKNPTVTRKQLTDILNVSDRTVSRWIKKLEDDNLIRRVGGKKQGHWEIVEDDTCETNSNSGKTATTETIPEKTEEEKNRELFRFVNKLTTDAFDGRDFRVLLDEFRDLAIKYGMDDSYLKDIKRRVIESYEYSSYYNDRDYAKYLKYFNEKWNIPYDIPHEEDGTTHYTGDITYFNNTHYVSGNDVIVFMNNKQHRCNNYTLTT